MNCEESRVIDPKYFHIIQSLCAPVCWHFVLEWLERSIVELDLKRAC